VPRQIQIVYPSDQAERLLARLREFDGVIGTRLQRGASRHPPGDVISLDVLNRNLPALCRFLTEQEVGADASSSVSTSEPLSLVDASMATAIARDTSEATWEEMELFIGKESNMTVSAVMVMFISGIIATVGIATNALHLVLGAMMIAPGFLPIVRISLGIVARSAAWRRGVTDIFKAYVALSVGAALAALLLDLLGHPPLGAEASYLPAGTLISYWTTLTPLSLIASTVSGVAGAVLLATGRSVLTAGVMVALALVPGAAITGMGAVAGDFAVAAGGLLRWATDVAIVMVTALLVFVWKRTTVHKRSMTS
jgi:uncharacterized membrane protein